MICEIPIKIESVANKREHWSEKYKREKTQKLAIKLNIKVLISGVVLPVKIKLIRVAPRFLDYDNLVSACKHIVDVLADMLKPGLAPGRADSDKDMTFVYEQRKGIPKEYKLVIEIVEDEAVRLL